MADSWRPFHTASVSGAEAVRMQSVTSARPLCFHTGSVCHAQLNHGLYCNTDEYRHFCHIFQRSPPNTVCHVLWCMIKSKVKVSFIVNSATCTVHTYRELKLRYSLTPWCIQITLNTNSRTQKYRSNIVQIKSNIYIYIYIYIYIRHVHKSLRSKSKSSLKSLRSSLSQVSSL